MEIRRKGGALRVRPLPWKRLFLVLLVAWMFAPSRPARALPAFSGRYGVPCSTCHTVAPHLNSFGLAFQANFFHWPAGAAPPRKTGLATLPFSGIATASGARNSTLGTTSNVEFRALELYASEGYTLGSGREGGYFIDYVAAIKDARAGDLRDAWVSLPIAGRRGQFAITAGQFTPLMYQYDPVNSLPQTQPAGLDQAVSGVSFAAPVPGVRLDYFDRRGEGTADGNYVSFGLPYREHLTLNRDSHLYGGRGAFLQAFHRQGYASVGAFGFADSGKHSEGLIGTYEATTNFYLLGVGSLAHDDFGNRHGLSLQADYVALPGLALTGRLEAVGGGSLHDEQYPVAAITYYPFHQSYVRLTGETVQQKGNRISSLYVFVQF